MKGHDVIVAIHAKVWDVEIAIYGVTSTGRLGTNFADLPFTEYVDIR